MATILLNGIETVLQTITGTELADKLTVRGGAQNIEAFMLGSDDLIEVEADNEDVDATLRGGEGEDVIRVTAGDPTELDWVGTVNIGGSLIGGVGNDEITAGDGLATITGDVKGNEGDDTITVARAEGAYITGNSDNDDINLGFAASYGTAAGSRAEALISNSTIHGASGKDSIHVLAGTTINSSKIRGNDDDDYLSAVEGTFGNNNLFAGNKGDDEIDIAKLKGEGNVARGGLGFDTIRGGNGQDAYGGIGADVFSVEAEGGMYIKDYDIFNVNINQGEDDYDCDDQIQIDGHKIFYTTNEYCVTTDVFSSDPFFKGDLVVKGYVNNASLTANANAYVSTTTTTTATAKAVAHIRFENSKTTGAFTLPEVTYTDPGNTRLLNTFENGLDGLTSQVNNATIFNAKDAMRGTGIGAGYAFAEGYWTNNIITEVDGVDKRVLKGQVRTIMAQTSAQVGGSNFSETFNFSGNLDAFSQQTDRTERYIVFNDVVEGIVTNHWASYNKNKTSEIVNLYELNFGTALFKTVTTGKAYQKVLNEQTIEPFSTFYDSDTVYATASTSIDYKKKPFSAWKENFNGTGIIKTSLSETRWWTKIQINKTMNLVAPVTKSGNKISQSGELDTTARMLFTTGVYSSSPARIGFFVNPNTISNQTYYESIKTLGSGTKTEGVYTVNKTLNKWRQYNTASEIFTPTKKIGSGQLLTENQLMVSTLRNRGLLTLTTSAIYGGKSSGGKYTGSNNNTAGTTVQITRGVGNTDRSLEIYETGSAKLGIKIRATASTTDSTYKYLSAASDITTLEGVEINLNDWRNFPEVGSSGEGSVYDNSFIDNKSLNQYLQWDGSNNLQNLLGIGEFTPSGDPLPSIVTSNYDTRNGNQVSALNVAGNNGFFSASTFTLGAVGMTNFGDSAVAKIALNQGIGTSEVSTIAPFRVLFFDNDTADNGLYIYSGHAKIVAGDVTGLDYETKTTSSMGGKHTIVKIEGPGAPVAMSDINLV